jgi:DNA-directed RNA polymerase subunit M/transcription elongation factor TFIIS
MDKVTFEDRVVARMWQLMPFHHECGTQMAPGAIANGPVLVCRSCSTVTLADPELMQSIVAQAVAEVEAESN